MESEQGNKFKKPNKYDHLEKITEEPEFCQAKVYIDAPDGVVPDYSGICGMEIKTMSYKGTGACGEVHRKLMAGESHGDLKPINPTGEC